MEEQKQKIEKLVDTFPHREGKTSLVSSAGVSKAIALEKSRAMTAEEHLADEIDGLRQSGVGRGEPVEQTFISGISFSVSNGKIIANITKKKGTFIQVTDAGTENIYVAAGI